MAALSRTGVSDETYVDQVFTDNGDDVVVLNNCGSMTFIRCTFNSTYGLGLLSNNGTGTLTIRDCTFPTDLNGGIYVFQHSSGSIQVLRNYCGGVYRAGHKDTARGQFIQCNGCDIPGSLVQGNRIIMGTANDKEDAISMFATHGSSGSPLIIEKNWVRGRGTSTTGGGILIGEIDGTYLTARENTVINTGVVGIGIAGGHHNTVQNNLLLSQTFTSGDSDYNMNSVGIYELLYAGSAQAELHDNTLNNNTVDWDYYTGGQNPTYFPNDGVSPFPVTTPNTTGTSLDYLLNVQFMNGLVNLAAGATGSLLSSSLGSISAALSILFAGSPTLQSGTLSAIASAVALNLGLSGNLQSLSGLTQIAAQLGITFGGASSITGQRQMAAVLTMISTLQGVGAIQNPAYALSSNVSLAFAMSPQGIAEYLEALGGNSPRIVRARGGSTVRARSALSFIDRERRVVGN